MSDNEDLDFISEFIPEHTFSFNRGRDEIGCGSIVAGIGIVIAILYILFEIAFKVLAS